MAALPPLARRSARSSFRSFGRLALLLLSAATGGTVEGGKVKAGRRRAMMSCPKAPQEEVCPWKFYGLDVLGAENGTFLDRDVLEDPPTCMDHLYNEELHAYNALEFDVDVDVVRDIYAEYAKDVKPHLGTGLSTEDFCLVTPYNPKTNTWETKDGRIRSDIKWYSVNNEETYCKYVNHFDRFGIKEKIKGWWIDSDEITIYTIFLIVRSHSEIHQFHIDWFEDVHTQVMTFLIPLNKFDIHLKYEDADDEYRGYNYTLGKAIGFGGGFIHSTDIGHGEEEDVLLCVYLGSDDPEIWKYALDNIADELEHYMSPLDGYVWNENLDESNCQWDNPHGPNSVREYSCPTGALGTSKNDVADYFNFYDSDHETHAEGGKDDDYYAKGFRDMTYGGRQQTYSANKKKMTNYKAKVFGDNLKSGDTIYESACGEGFNVLMTLEILREERGIDGLTAFGSEYLADSVVTADRLFEKQASMNDWLKKGKFCQGDSSNLDFVPSVSFDLAFAYIDPIVDPLRLHGEDMTMYDRIDHSFELCESDDEADRELARKEQRAQEDWHSSWIKELIRIVKPGKVVILEDVDQPVCDEDSDYGGVSFKWWKKAVGRYGWDVDPDSIKIMKSEWYDNRYNVLMRKNVAEAGEI